MKSEHVSVKTFAISESQTKCFRIFYSNVWNGRQVLGSENVTGEQKLAKKTQEAKLYF